MYFLLIDNYSAQVAKGVIHAHDVDCTQLVVGDVQGQDHSHSNGVEGSLLTIGALHTGTSSWLLYSKKVGVENYSLQKLHFFLN